MIEKPLVSIIVPCYNVEKYVEACINSVILQTYKNWECILINDGSKDHTLDLIKKIETEDDRIRIFSQENLGLSATRNKGIDNANGEFLFFLDSDDILRNDAISSLVSSYQDNDIITGITVVSRFSDDQMIKVSQLYPPKEGSITFSNQNYEVLIRAIESALTPTAQNRLYKKDFIAKNKLRFKEGILHEDELWFFEAMLVARNVKFIDQETYFYRTDNQDSITKNIGDRNLNSYLEILETVYNVYYQNNSEPYKKAVVARYLQYLKKLIIDFAIREKNKLNDKSIFKLQETFKKVYTQADRFRLLSISNEKYYISLNKLSLKPFKIIEKYFFRNPMNSIRKYFRLLLINLLK